MKDYTFRNTSNNAIITVQATGYESAMYLLIQSVRHPADWVLHKDIG